MASSTNWQSRAPDQELQKVAPKAEGDAQLTEKLKSEPDETKSRLSGKYDVLPF